MEQAKKRVRLTVAYDGTNYHGWQVQNNGITIESELNRCLTDLLKEPIEVIGASRTDSGVHALGNIEEGMQVVIPPADSSMDIYMRMMQNGPMGGF